MIEKTEIWVYRPDMITIDEVMYILDMLHPDMMIYESVNN